AVGGHPPEDEDVGRTHGGCGLGDRRAVRGLAGPKTDGSGGRGVHRVGIGRHVDLLDHPLLSLGSVHAPCPGRGRSQMTDSGSDSRKWLVLAVVGAAFFMTILDVAIVNVAIPSIQKDLHIAESTVQWVITAYAITFGGFLLLGGRMADLLGRRRI